MKPCPPCSNSLKPPSSKSYCARPDVVWCWENGPVQAAVANVFLCKSCHEFQFIPTEEFDKHCYRLAMEEAAHKDEAEAERKRRRFSVFFGIRGNANDATRRFG